jgi:acyl-CoA reductase-like NAD-dependent aldehyde dehydrogenase
MTTDVQQQMQRLSGCNYIFGAYLPGAGPRVDVIDPATEEVTGRRAEATIDEIDSAVRHANAAQRLWWAQSALERSEALHEVSRRLKSLREAIGECMTREMGKPFRESTWEGGAAASSFDYYAELARHEQGRVAGPSIAGQMHMTLKEPLGVVVSVVPFNYPVLLFGWQAAAALAAGNAIVVKPSELTTLTVLLAMGAFEHLPPGLVQVISGGPDAGRRLVEHADTHAVAFTGSVPAGQAVAQAAARRFKPTLIEASGNDPFIVMPSAPIQTAVKGAAFAAFLNCGQVCTAAERFYVHRDVYPEFVAGLAREAQALRVGNGLERVDMGPMASQRERERYERIVASAIGQGARVLAGARRPAHLARGWFVEPTVLEVTHDMDILRGESFGPVAPVCRVDSLDQAIGLANRSEFGLGANIYTSDLSESMRAVHELEAGMVWVNTPLNDNDAVAFGGRKMSGAGRELGAEGLNQFRRAKMVMIAPQARPDPEWFPYPDEDAFQAR